MQSDWLRALVRFFKKRSNQLLSFLNVYLHAENQANWPFRSRDIAVLRILQSDWLRTFWPISPEPEFSQIWGLCSLFANHKSFHFRLNAKKVNDKILQKPWKTLFLAHFGPILPHFGTIRFFSKNRAPSRTTLHRSASSCKISKKSNEPIPQKRLDRRTNGRTDGQTWIHRTLPATAGGPI